MVFDVGGDKPPPATLLASPSRRPRSARRAGEKRTAGGHLLASPSRPPRPKPPRWRETNTRRHLLASPSRQSPPPAPAGPARPVQGHSPRGEAATSQAG